MNITEGYKLIMKTRSSKRVGGVAAYVRENLNVHAIPEIDQHKDIRIKLTGD